MNKQLTLISLLLLIGCASAAYKCLEGTNGCSACDAAKANCTGCRAGWFLDSTVKQCKQCTVTGCITCTDNQKCTAAAAGYVLSADAPVKCQDGCAACSKTATQTDTTCTAPASGFWLKVAVAPASGFVPTPCFAGCDVCKDDLVASCQIPKPAFFFDVGLGKCTVANCLLCQNNRTICTYCKDGWNLNSATPKTCDACIANCAVCANKTECTTCKIGYRYNSTGATKVCEACTPANCNQCDGSIDTCAACQQYYSWVAPSCLKCADNCLACAVAGQCNSGSCATGYAYNPVNFTCGKGCSSNCTGGCSNAGYLMCDSCDAGFGKKSPAATPVDSTCQACGANCEPTRNCDTNGAGKCDACKTGFALNTAFACIACTSVTGCATCNITGTTTVACLTCNTGFAGIYGTPAYCVSCVAASTLPGTTTVTTNFDANAISCSVNLTSGDITISSCKTGYTKFNNKCVNCVATSTVLGTSSTLFSTAALTCSIKVTITVQACATGFFLNSTTLQCGACGAQAKTCTSNTVALTCNDGYFLNSTNVCTLCTSGVTKTISCSSAAVDTVCKPGHFLNGSTCTACTSGFAITCSAAAVDVTCKDGYFLNTATCTACTSGFAITCSAAAVDVTCKPGYFLSTATCTACTSGNAITCSAAGVDTSCKPGYFLKTTGTICTICTGLLAATCGDGANAAIPDLTCLSATSAPGNWLDTSVTPNLCKACGTGALTCTNATVALTCDVGYVLLNGQCLSCTITTSTATGSIGTTGFSANATVCKVNVIPSAETCASGFQKYAITINNAVQYSICASCTSNSAIYGGTTSGATSNCVTCTVLSLVVTCTSCSTGFALVSGQCVACDTNCTPGLCTSNGAGKCDNASCAGSNGLTSTYNCAACAANCSSCKQNGAGQCDTGNCNPGYYLTSSGNLCQACAANCLACSVGGQCSTCKGGYYLSSNICLPCYSTEKCTCISAATLLDCTPENTWGKYFVGTTLSSTNSAITTISACVQNCVLCFGSSFTECLQAAPKFFLDTSAVTACAPGCDVCTGATADKCVQVTAGFYKATQNTTVVLTACPAGCAGCSANGANVTCNACPADLGGSVQDKAITTGFTCTYNCIANCDKCTTQDNAGCSACKTGFKKDSTGACVSQSASNTTATNTTGTANAQLISAIFVTLLVALFLLF